MYTGPGPKNGIVNSGMDIHGPQRTISSKSQKHNMPIQTNNISVISAHPVNKKKNNRYKYLLIYLHNFKIHKYSGITNEEQ